MPTYTQTTQHTTHIDTCKSIFKEVYNLCPNNSRLLPYEVRQSTQRLHTCVSFWLRSRLLCLNQVVLCSAILATSGETDVLWVKGRGKKGIVEPQYKLQAPSEAFWCGTPSEGSISTEPMQDVLTNSNGCSEHSLVNRWWTTAEDGREKLEEFTVQRPRDR